MSRNHVPRRRTYRGLLAGFALLAILAVSLLAYGGRDANAVAAATAAGTEQRQGLRGQLELRAGEPARLAHPLARQRRVVRLPRRHDAAQPRRDGPRRPVRGARPAGGALRGRHGHDRARLRASCTAT